MAEREKKAAGSILAKAVTKAVTKEATKKTKKAKDIQHPEGSLDQKERREFLKKTSNQEKTREQKDIEKGIGGGRFLFDESTKLDFQKPLKHSQLPTGPKGKDPDPNFIQAFKKAYQRGDETFVFQGERFDTLEQIRPAKTNYREPSFFPTGRRTGYDEGGVSEMPNEEEMKAKYAVGSVAQKAVEGSDSLLEAAKEDVNRINRGPAEDTLLSTPDRGTPEMQGAEQIMDDPEMDADDELDIPVPVLASVWFSENTEPPKQEQLEDFEDAFVDAVIDDSPVFEFQDKVYSIDKASKMEIEEDIAEEREQFFFGGFLKKLRGKKKMKKKLSGGFRGIFGRLAKRIKEKEQPQGTKKLPSTATADAAAAMATAQFSGNPMLQGDSARQAQVGVATKLGNVVAQKFPNAARRERYRGKSGFFGRLGSIFGKRRTPVRNTSPLTSLGSLAILGKLNAPIRSKKVKQFKKARSPLAEAITGKYKKTSPFRSFGKKKFGKSFTKKFTRFGFEEGGMPVDTYPNIQPEEMEAVKASQLPDSEMEAKYEEFVLNEALSPVDQDYLGAALEQDAKLATLFDRVMDTATEFSGAGAVEGIGTGTSDSIPARLSDGEFVFTAKAVEQLGADNLQMMMDQAEAEFDGREGRAYGGSMRDGYAYGSMVSDDEDDSTMFEDDEDMSEELKTMMLDANQMPRA